MEIKGIETRVKIRFAGTDKPVWRKVVGWAGYRHDASGAWMPSLVRLHGDITLPVKRILEAK